SMTRDERKGAPPNRGCCGTSLPKSPGQSKPLLQLATLCSGSGYFCVEVRRSNPESDSGMDPSELVPLARRLLSCPVAPFYEAGVRAVVETVCAEHGLD